jgi:hypothetical protein
MEERPTDLVYKENPKHKRGCSGEGPPRWFPSTDSLCPEDISASDAETLLQASIETRDDVHPNRSARIALDSQGRFFKGYSEDGGRTWHGFPIRRDLVPRQIPAKILREFVKRGLLNRSDYKKLLGSAS